MREFLVLILRAPNGSVVVLAVAASAVSPRSVELSLLVARARASAPPQPELPWFTEGEAVEPRPARAVSALEVVVDASTTDARTAGEIWPRRSLKRERELRQQAALSAFVRQAQQARSSPRQARAAWQLQQVMLLAAALRRAGFPR
jgi:hypothetical protein